MLVDKARKAKRIIDFVNLVSAHKESGLWLKIIDMRLNHRQEDLVTIERRFVDFPNLIDPAYPLDWKYLEGRILLSQDRLNAATRSMLPSGPEDRNADATADLHGEIARRIRELEKKRSTASSNEKYLVIRACGIGLWGEINHVIAQLVFAKWTKRIPYVFWGKECLYNDGSEENAFLQYFSSWGEHRSAISGMARFFPDDFWSKENVFGANTRKYTFSSPREHVGLDILGRDEDVLVVDSYVALEVLLEWLPEGHEYGGRSGRDLYGDLFAEYLKVRPEISALIEGFWERQMKGISFVAVHARGGDRAENNAKLAENDRLYFDKIETMCRPEEKIFLCTDSRFIYEDFLSKYEDRLVAYPSQRTTGSQGLHNGSSANRSLAGTETLIEVLLAVRCAKFIGCSSNVSGTILTLGRWEASHVFHDLPSLTL